MPNDTSLRFRLQTLAQTKALGQSLGERLAPGTVILLEGDLGTGKTTFVQGLGAELGITEAIVSPTFGLIHEYHEGRIPLYHFDLYRLSPAEVYELHPETYWLGLETPLGITAIEWPERLADWPEHHLSLKLTHATQGRIATLEAFGVVAHWEEIKQSLVRGNFGIDYQ
jgi:tRNA threonylcarbamoyladenosine biosynthesis protein TsaE